MQTRITDQRCDRLAVLSGVLAFALLTATQVDAGKPAPDPGPDVFIDFNFAWFEATGAIEEWGDVDVVDDWTDEDGVVWLRLRYHHGAEDPYFFETVLPSEPKNNWKYPFELIAGPDGYLSGGVLYEGVFADGTATGTTRDVWRWDYDYWADKRYKYQVTEVYWDPLEAYLLP